MTGPNTDDHMDELLRGEMAAWTPAGAPNMHDVLRRAERGWQRPIAAYSALASVALAIVLVAAVVILLLGSHVGATESIRERLLAH